MAIQISTHAVSRQKDTKFGEGQDGGGGGGVLMVLGGELDASVWH
jgi:hypothetical protein